MLRTTTPAPALATNAQNSYHVKHPGTNCCCSLWESHSDQWACLCCQYPHGIVPSLLLQLLEFLAVLCSIATVVDCRLFEIHDSYLWLQERNQNTSSTAISAMRMYNYNSTHSDGTRTNETMSHINSTNGVGYFLFAKNHSGECYLYQDHPNDPNVSQSLVYYTDEFLGDIGMAVASRRPLL
jgi:hypothetical protein